MASLFTGTLGLCAVIFAIVAVLVAVCLVRFRERPGAPEPSQIEGHKRLEIVWTLIPCLIVATLFVLTGRTMAAADPPAEGPADLVVIGHQWWWEARYPNGAVTANEIHIPSGKDLIVRVESVDVVHDFWAPALGRKIDATPGHPVTVRIQAEEPGIYHGACAEYCGTQHAWMRFEVYADAPADFDAWLARQAAGAGGLGALSDPAQRGAALFKDRTCSQCHAIRGLEPTVGSPAPSPPPGGATAATRQGTHAAPTAAPDLTHFGSRKTIGATIMPNTPEDLYVWLKYPQSVKPGCHMPSLRLTDSETDELASLLSELP